MSVTKYYLPQHIRALERQLAERDERIRVLEETLRFVGACGEGIRKCAEYVRDGTTAAPNISTVLDDISKQGGLIRNQVRAVLAEPAE